MDKYVFYVHFKLYIQHDIYLILFVDDSWTLDLVSTHINYFFFFFNKIITVFVYTFNDNGIMKTYNVGRSNFYCSHRL